MNKCFSRLAMTATLALAASGLPAFADIELTSGEKIMEFASEPVVVSGTATLRLTSDDPLRGATISINGDDATVIFEGLLCSEVQEKCLPFITINGHAFNPEADRLSIWGNGAEIIPDGLLNPLTVFSTEDCTGESLDIPVDVYYRGEKVSNKQSYLPQELLGSFDNSIRSFRLKRGYRVCFANNSDGTGFSRVFTAADKDLVITAMPEGLEFASFVRVSRADRIGKRGICGRDLTPLTRSAWYYSWGASDESAQNFEFVPMRHNKSWDGWDKIGSRVDTSCVLAYNEPDHSDQSNLSVSYALYNWDEFMKSGLRVGSPAPDSLGKDWLTKFIQAADSLNYRVDFAVVHMYWNSQTGAGLTSRIANTCRETYNGRTLWITEWNNGANWTHEAWPDKEGVRLDADFNPLLDENGNQTTVTRPHTQKNSEVQTAWLAEMLQAFDDCPWLERHAFYNWVEDARMVEIGGKLTPAGKVFTEFRSRPGFNPKYEYVHKWKIAPPLPKFNTYNTYSMLNFPDHNGETGISYTIQRRLNGGEWEDFATLEAGKDYTVGKTVSIRIPYDVDGWHSFRVKAMSYKGEESIWSRVLSIRVTASGVEAVEGQPEAFRAEVRDNVLYLTALNAGEYPIYSADGRLQRIVSLTSGDQTPVYGLERGIYIVNSKKVIL